MTTDPTTLEQLLADFPLPAVYGGGGPHLMLRWGDEDRQGQLMFQPVRPAGGEADARRVLLAGARLSLHAGVRLRSLSRVDVVGPPPSLRLALARDLLTHESQAFWWEAEAEALRKDDEGRRGATPSWLAPCEACRGRGSNCSECHGLGAVLAGDEDARLVRYIGLRPRWRAVLNARLVRARKRPLPPERPTRAPEAAEGEALWAAYGEHRHHGKGTFVAPLKGSAPAPLLLFRQGPELDYAEFSALVARLRAEFAREYDERRLAAEEAQRAEAGRRRAEYLDLLGG